MSIITFLDGQIRNSILNDVKDVARYHSRHYTGKQGGFFGIPRQVFCYVDYLGLIAFGNKSSTKRTIDFIKEYFPDHYKDYAELLYVMWRLGTVHEYKPKTYFYNNFNSREMVVKVSWLSNNDNHKRNRKENMKFYSLHNSNRDVRLAINICQLVDDLLFSLGGFINALKRNTKYEEECQERFDAWMCDHDYKEIDRKWLKEKVGDQLKLAWNNRAGKIDSKGKVVEWYKTHQK